MRLSVWLGLGGQSCLAYISSLVFQPRIGIPAGDRFWKTFLPVCGLSPTGPRLFSRKFQVGETSEQGGLLMEFSKGHFGAVTVTFISGEAEIRIRERTRPFCGLDFQFFAPGAF